MLLKDILKGTNVILNADQQSIEVKQVKIKIEEICKGDLFLDLNGTSNINDVLKEKPAFVVRFAPKNKNEGRNIYSYNDMRGLFAIACKNLSYCACDDLTIIGVTGTNGKTSTVKLIADILKQSGKKVATIGTMGAEFLGTVVDTGFTTPDPDILHDLLYKMRLSGVTHVVMEVSAHAIYLKKLEGIKFEVLAITNITQDHLDFFETIENYSQTKLKIFNKKNVKQAVVCADDERCRQLIQKPKIPTISYGTECPSDIFAIDIKTSFKGTSFICNCLDEIFRVDSRLVGDYNVLNILCAIGVCNLLKLQLRDICMGILNSESEVGRFNVTRFNGINVVIDYAHTPDGLQKVLNTTRGLCSGKVFLVFGCGGNRDSAKRPIMGSIAQLYCDHVILTSDNPRFEEPYKIIEDIKKGMTEKFEIEVDRRTAIYKGLSMCGENDCIIIAGKGGEKYQDIKGQKIPYSDFDEVYKFFRKWLAVYQHGEAYGN